MVLNLYQRKLKELKATKTKNVKMTRHPLSEMGTENPCKSDFT